MFSYFRNTDSAWIAAGLLCLMLAFAIHGLAIPGAAPQLNNPEQQIRESAQTLLTHWGASEVSPADRPKLIKQHEFTEAFIRLNGKRAMRTTEGAHQARIPFYVWQAGYDLALPASAGESAAADSSTVTVLTKWSESSELVELQMEGSRQPVLSHGMGPLGADVSDTLAVQRARSFLNESIWSRWQKTVTHVSRESAEADFFYLIRFSVDEAAVPSELTVELSSSGALLRISHSPTAGGPEVSVAETIVSVLISGLIPAFILILLIGQFFKRQYNRMMDLRIARSDSLLIGLIGGAFIAVTVFVMNETPEQQLYLRLLLSGGLFLITSLLFSALALVLFSTADSLVQEAWPEKKHAITYIRHGFLLNTQVGKALARGLGGGAAMSLLYTLTLIAADFSAPSVSPEQDSILSAFGNISLLYVPGESLLTAVLLCTFFLLIPGSWLKLRGLSTAAAAGLLILGLSSVSLAPDHPVYWFELLHKMMLACIPVLLFLRYDNLSAITAIFVFVLVNHSIYSYFAPHLPDVLPLVMNLGLIGGLGLLAIAGLRSKTELTELPDVEPEYLKRLAREKRIEKEFELAREVHDSFLTSVKPDIPGFDIAASCNTAYEVGGDYFDFISLDEHRTLVVIADVSGKGVKAAFFMTLLKGYLQAVADQHRDVAEIIKIVNRLFHANSPRGTFITALAGVLDARSGEFTFVRAGHDPLLLLNAQTGTAEVHQPNGFALGMARPAAFDVFLETRRFTLQNGEAIVLFTDGYAESFNPAREQLGEKKLAEVAGSLYRSNPLGSARLLEAVHAEVLRFSAGAHQHDDMTMIVLQKR
ncbi:MAG: PP2C family protein-serine/threonine phosphatase [Candidatus Cyclonatronum sp.]|uniref:PP2C family protein-serine/threonine phosphatase n=1 Tax=Cyclonatronum sp. TaxID=3024185 RepID=UPI0025BC11C3|nr:PP2C family protein-serine/threonine phosphatase [Cyclonatronum sp.]MCH8485255.1 PP2C family protein-serine/threonine phosphatase [Cyclonatronum sp.]